jgi:hypothetical protein
VSSAYQPEETKKRHVSTANAGNSCSNTVLAPAAEALASPLLAGYHHPGLKTSGLTVTQRSVPMRDANADILFIGLGCLSLIVGIIVLVCYILIIIKMFQAEDTGIAIACIVLLLCMIGPILAFILGWINVRKYRAENIMYAWTIAIVISLMLRVVGILVEVATR